MTNAAAVTAASSPGKPADRFEAGGAPWRKQEANARACSAQRARCHQKTNRARLALINSSRASQSGASNVQGNSSTGDTRCAQEKVRREEKIMWNRPPTGDETE